MKRIVIKRVCMEMILIPLSYKINPTTNITKALKSEGGESKKSRYASKTALIKKKESIL